MDLQNKCKTYMKCATYLKSFLEFQQGFESKLDQIFDCIKNLVKLSPRSSSRNHLSISTIRGSTHSTSNKTSTTKDANEDLDEHSDHNTEDENAIIDFSSSGQDTDSDKDDDMNSSYQSSYHPFHKTSHHSSKRIANDDDSCSQKSKSKRSSKTIRHQS